MSCVCVKTIQILLVYEIAYVWKTYQDEVLGYPNGVRGYDRGQCVDEITLRLTAIENASRDHADMMVSMPQNIFSACPQARKTRSDG